MEGVRELDGSYTVSWVLCYGSMELTCSRIDVVLVLSHAEGSCLVPLARSCNVCKASNISSETSTPPFVTSTTVTQSEMGELSSGALEA